MTTCMLHLPGYGINGNLSNSPTSCGIRGKLRYEGCRTNSAGCRAQGLPSADANGLEISTNCEEYSVERSRMLGPENKKLLTGRNVYIHGENPWSLGSSLRKLTNTDSLADEFANTDDEFGESCIDREHFVEAGLDSSVKGSEFVKRKCDDASLDKGEEKFARVQRVETDLLRKFLASRTGAHDVRNEARIWKGGKKLFVGKGRNLWESSLLAVSKNASVASKEQQSEFPESRPDAVTKHVHASSASYQSQVTKKTPINDEDKLRQPDSQQAHQSKLNPLQEKIDDMNHVSVQKLEVCVGDEKLTSEVFQIVKTKPQDSCLDDLLTSFTGKLSSEDANLVLQTLCAERLLWPTLSFFQWMRLQKPALVDPRSFSIIFRFLGKMDMVDRALVLFQNLPDEKSFHCAKVYNSLYGAFIKCHREDEIWNLLQIMQQRNVEPDVSTWSILISGTKQEGYRLKKVWSICADMMKKGLKPSDVVFGNLIKAFCDEGHVEDALLIAGVMEKKGTCLNVVIYNTLIDAYGKALKLEEAEGLLLEMKERGLAPTESTYNSLINAYGQKGHLEVAENLFLEMQESGMTPNVVTYTSLINAYGKQRQTQKAVSTFLKMKQNDIVPNTYTYTALLHAYSRGGWYDNAERAFQTMVREGLAPTVETYTALLDCYRQGRQLDKVVEVWKKMRDSKCRFTKVTYDTLMDAFAKEGRHEEARDVMSEFRVLGFKPDVTTFNILINAYGRAGRLWKAIRVMKKEMKTAGCEPNAFSYCTLIYTCLRLRDFTRAFVFDKEMRTEGKLPDERTYEKLRIILDAKLSLKEYNDKKAELGQLLRVSPSVKNPQKKKPIFNKNLLRKKQGRSRSSTKKADNTTERGKALWKRSGSVPS